MESLLIATNLKKSFGDTHAVKDISLSIKPGECLALLGPNGAGKTTTVEMLEGLVPPDSGSIKIFGRDLKSERSQIMQELGVMLQDTQMYKRMTVRETLQLFQSFFDKTMTVEEAISLVELQDKAEVQLGKLSGGQKQRTYLACALINHPKLLFLDEPTTGLDPAARRLIWDLLLKHKGKDRGILLTTHYMDEAEKLADRIAIVDAGKIVDEGTPEELIRRITGDQVLCFRLNRPEDFEQLIKESSITWLKDAVFTDGQYELPASDSLSKLSELFRAADRLGLTLDHMELRRSTLEDVFIKLTGRNLRDVQ